MLRLLPRRLGRILIVLYAGALSAQFKGFQPAEFYLDKATLLGPASHPPVRTQYGLGFCYASAAATLVDYERLGLMKPGTPFGEGEMLSLQATLLMANEGAMKEGGLIGAALERIQDNRTKRPRMLVSERAAPYETFQLATYDKAAVYKEFDTVMAALAAKGRTLDAWERRNLLGMVAYRANNAFWDGLKADVLAFLKTPVAARDPKPILAKVGRMSRACVGPDKVGKLLASLPAPRDSDEERDWSTFLSGMLSQICRPTALPPEASRPLEVPAFTVDGINFFEAKLSRVDWAKQAGKQLKALLARGKAVGVGMCLCEELHDFRTPCPSGHAVVISGIAEAKPVHGKGESYLALRIQNSWGEEWQEGFSLKEGTPQSPASGRTLTGWVEGTQILYRIMMMEWIER
ncbi:MAG TPA: hypothetical protein VJ623_02655 [Holophagaceae bacterium]|nr:hypothetical protein [Holophagaceae bacterium]